jgi:membrane protein implicated in regulation of membrane protease activity
MDWQKTLETTFLVMFGVGLLLTIVMAVMSGAFHSELGSGSSFEGGVAHDLGGPHIGAGDAPILQSGQPEVGWSEGEIPGFSPWSPTVVCATLTGAGGLGYIAVSSWNMGVGGSIAFAVVGGLALGGLTFFTLAWLFSRLQSSSHVATADLVGRHGSVTTQIAPGATGAVSFEAAGSRMVVPARSVDAAVIPEGAEVEIVRIDGTVYHVKETRESWLGRSKQQTKQ